MMWRLKNRQIQIPGGFRFYQPETKWSPQRYRSFENTVAQVIAHRQANPHLAATHGWNMSAESIANELDSYNAKICQVHRWFNYIYQTDIGDPGPPLTSRPSSSLLNRLGGVAAGARVIVDWLKSGAEAVDPALAEKRALVCAACPLNTQGDLTSLFTLPVSNAIRAALNQRSTWNIRTSVDSSLGVCDACLCPLKLKVHLPMAMMESKMDKETFDALAPGCWFRSESVTRVTLA